MLTDVSKIYFTNFALYKERIYQRLTIKSWHVNGHFVARRLTKTFLYCGIIRAKLQMKYSPVEASAYGSRTCAGVASVLVGDSKQLMYEELAMLKSLNQR